MLGGDNSSKRDRLSLEDIEKIIATEQRTGIYPMSWYSRLIWDYIVCHYINNIDKIQSIYRNVLKQNVTNFMFILWSILNSCGENGKHFLVEAFLKPKFKYFEHILAEAMQRLWGNGYRITMHVHDEVVLEVPNGQSSVEEVAAIMGETPTWADGLCLRADGYECEFYKKE